MVYPVAVEIHNIINMLTIFFYQWYPHKNSVVVLIHQIVCSGDWCQITLTLP